MVLLGGFREPWGAAGWPQSAVGCCWVGISQFPVSAELQAAPASRLQLALGVQLQLGPGGAGSSSDTLKRGLGCLGGCHAPTTRDWYSGSA